MKRRYTVETLRAGQPRKYADSEYVYRVTIEHQGNAGLSDKNAPFIPHPELDPKLATETIRGLVGGWVDHEALGHRSLRSCRMVAPGVWEVVLISPYCD